MVEVLDVLCQECDSPFIVFERETRDESELGTRGGFGIFGVGRAEAARNRVENGYRKEEKLFCQCPKCLMHHEFYIEDVLDEATPKGV